ncbi:MAG: glycosyltransferase [Thermoplasmatales archaeon]|nr:glycosyltransferase [Thermoplasmatales archaeon]
MKKLPKISIITPSLNQGQFIERTILSILNQDYPNIEYIVMDGGSTDNTVEILKKYADRLIWKSEPDKGQSDAINKGFRMATGEILAWLNSDDTYKAGAIKTMAGYLIEHPEADMVYSDGEIVDVNDKVIGVFKSGSVNLRGWLYCGGINIFQPGVFFKNSVIEKIGLLDESLHYNMDTDYWIRMAQTGLSMRHIEKPLARLRWHKAAKTYPILRQHRRLHLLILRKYGGFPFLFYFFRYILMVEMKRVFWGDRKLFSGKTEMEGQRFFNEDDRR